MYFFKKNRKEKSEEEKKIERARASIKGLRGEARIKALQMRSKQVEQKKKLHSRANKSHIRRKINMLKNQNK